MNERTVPTAALFEQDSLAATRGPRERRRGELCRGRGTDLGGAIVTTPGVLMPRRPHRLIATAGALIVALVSILPVGATAAPADYSATSTQLAQDSFDRTLTGTWGNTANGLAWTSSTPTSLSVTGGSGIVALTPGSTVTNSLPAFTSTDVRSSFTVAAASSSAGLGASAAISARTVGDRGYSASVRFASGNKLTLKVERTGSGATTLLQETLVSKEAAPGTPFMVELQVTGTDPVEISARVWKSGTAQPAWQYTVTDSSASRITSAGALTIRSWSDTGNPKTSLQFLDVGATPLVKSAGTPSPSPSPTPTTNPTPTTSPTTAPAPSPSASPSPSPTPTPSPAPTTAPTATPSAVGALPIGQANYPVPSGALYVDDKGTESGTGTAASPYGSLQYAVTKAPAGSTLVLRSGRYHESVEVPFYKKLTIQNYPGEAVWLDGSSTISSWTASGTRWFTPWTVALDNRVSSTPGVDESSRFVDPAYPMSRYPEQVWVNGAKLTQVGSLGAVTATSFYVDAAAKRLYVGTNPSGKTIDASTLSSGLHIYGEGTTIRGIGVRRYANHLAAGGAIAAKVANITLENVMVQDNATQGVTAWNKGNVFTRITVSGNGLLGIGANKADNLTITNSRVDGNNSEHFKPAPVSGGLKITESVGVRISQSSFENNIYAGIWFDAYSKNMTISRNTLRGNTGSAVQIEAGANPLIVGNYLVENVGSGLRLINTSGSRVWNNTITGNGNRAIWLQQDSRDVSTSVWFTKSVQVRNNLIALPGGTNCPVIYDDISGSKLNASTLGLSFDNNLWYRASATSPERLTCLPNGSGTLQSTRTWSALQTVGWEKSGRLIEGAAPVDANYALTAAAKTTGAAASIGVPADVAALLGVTTGWRGIGPTSAVSR